MQRAGFETYFPQYLMIWRDRQRQVRPLFPRYTFVRFDSANQPWSMVVRDPGGQELGQMMVEPTTRRPYTIPDAVIDALLAEAAPDRIIYPPEPRIMHRGDVGRVTVGPLAELSGICSRTSRDRVWLLLNILGRRSEVQFDRDSVEIL
jgi:transcription antitermination factor NusG